MRSLEMSNASNYGFLEVLIPSAGWNAGAKADCSLERAWGEPQEVAGGILS